jgi:acyl-CoA synthetase (AMP-forming)/AMP-acid ligase II
MGRGRLRLRDSTAGRDDVIAHCNARLARYKVPKSVFVTDAIERTASGKVQKHVLRARMNEMND